MLACQYSLCTQDRWIRWSTKINTLYNYFCAKKNIYYLVLEFISENFADNKKYGLKQQLSNIEAISISNIGLFLLMRTGLSLNLKGET